MTPAVLLGQAIGDALGMPFEKRRDAVHRDLPTWDGTFRPGSYHKLPPGHWTDDTEMAVALAESLIERGDYDGADAAQRYLAWFQGTPHGMGGTTRTAMTALAAGTPWTDCGVQFPDGEEIRIGNGTAMRVAPLGALYTPELHGQLRHACDADARITHNHAEAVSASCAIAFLVTAVLREPTLRGAQMLQVASSASRIYLPPTKVGAALDTATDLFAQGVTPKDAIFALGRHGNAIETVATSVYCAAYHASDFRAGVVAAVRGGGDTDTRGAITGAILGARNGVGGIPDEYLAGVLQAEYLRELDAKLVAMRKLKKEALREVASG